MRKSIFLTLILSLCVVDLGAFAATSPRGNTRGSGANTGAQQAGASVSARAASTRQIAGSSKTSANSARAATQQTKTPAVTARAATQKALSMGTKVATATANTAVSESCQDAYYGCMDAFCMLDNAAGGRCQCSDRVVELNAVLDEIMRIDEQSTRIATEGVEKVQMGEFADQINNRAKSIESEFDGLSKTTSTRTLSIGGTSFDLTSFADAGMFDAGEEETFQETSVSDIAAKTGDNLQNSAAKLCVARIPNECKDSAALLQMAYMQKIKSDCIGYENALKQQKIASQQKLLAAQKAVRDAVLTDVREKNKYATAGECAIAFAQCMQTTAECKSDYTGCVTLAAAENVRSNKSGSIAKQVKIKGVVSGADITLAATTMESLLAKKEICASVTRQCVNANKDDAVWEAFLRNAAPALKAAELIAERDLRSNCIPSVAECFKTACRAQFLDNEESYDMCLSNPATYKTFCKVQLEPCLEATGGTYEKPEESSLWNGLVAMLNSMKVDTCTQEVKDCLTDRCGADYSGCIGLDTYSIVNLCPIDKLTACASATNSKDGTPYYKDEAAIREYVAEVAQGLALQIDNALVDACQNAADEVMVRICGDTESCDAIKLDLSTLATLMKVQACALQKDKDGNENRFCLPDETQFTDDEIYGMGYGDQIIADANANLINAKDEILKTVSVWDMLLGHDGYVTDKTNDIAYGNQLLADAKLIRKFDEKGMSSYGVYATLLNRPDVSNITFGESKEGAEAKFYAQTIARPVDDTLATMIVDNFSQQSTDAAVGILQGVLDRMVSQLNTDPRIVYCKTGREVQGFRADEKFGKKGQKNARLPQLTDKYEYIIANSLLGKLSEQNSELEDKFSDDIFALDKKISERVAKIAKSRGAEVENVLDARNLKICNSYTSSTKSVDAARLTLVRTEAIYDSDTNVCTMTKTRYYCYDTWRAHTMCEDDGWDNGTSIGTQSISMPKFQ